MRDIDSAREDSDARLIDRWWGEGDYSTPEYRDDDEAHEAYIEERESNE
jgi:hypothetical protein